MCGLSAELLSAICIKHKSVKLKTSRLASLVCAGVLAVGQVITSSSQSSGLNKVIKMSVSRRNLANFGSQRAFPKVQCVIDDHIASSASCNRKKSRKIDEAVRAEAASTQRVAAS